MKVGHNFHVPSFIATNIGLNRLPHSQKGKFIYLKAINLYRKVCFLVPKHILIRIEFYV